MKHSFLNKLFPALLGACLWATSGWCYDFTVWGADPQWQQTTFLLTAGQQYSITASGWIASDTGGTPASLHNPDSVTQTGYGPYGPAPAPFIAPGLVSYSLVGRVDDGSPFQLGTSTILLAPASGTLSFAFNDEYFNDNSGFWRVTVIPEPGSALLLGFGLLGIFLIKRKARRWLG